MTAVATPAIRKYIEDRQAASAAIGSIREQFESAPAPAGERPRCGHDRVVS